jgi:hypothetical protein
MLRQVLVLIEAGESNRNGRGVLVTLSAEVGFFELWGCRKIESTHT